MKRILLIFSAIMLLMSACKNNKVDNTKISKQEIQEWQANKFGMFIHFGVYSQLGGIWRGDSIPYYAEQIMNHARISISDYENEARTFNPTKWNADEVVKMAKKAGMKYIVFTTKHHDGFCMFNAKTTNYNIVDYTPYGRDILKQLEEACQREGLKLGLYYSLPDWHFEQGIPRVAADTNSNCTQIVNQVYSPLETITPELENYIIAQVTELLTNYGEIETIWFDMGLVTPEQSKRLRKTVKDLQPKCLINGRIMNNEGDYLTLPDNGNVAEYDDVAWDNPASMYNTWGYKSWIQRPDPNAQADTQIERLYSTISHGGVFLLNVGPTGTGAVLNYEKEVLNKVAYWVNENAAAIYNTTPGPFAQLNGAYCTQRDNTLFFMISNFIDSIQCQGLKTPIKRAYLLYAGDTIDLQFTKNNKGYTIQVPLFATVNNRMLRPNMMQKDYFASKHHIVVAELENIAEVNVLYINENKNGFELTNDNGITHAALDATNYVTTQTKSWMSWNIEVNDGGEYDVFIQYLPENDAKQYLFETENQSIAQTLPGVDRMMQTAYVGKLQLNKGKNTFKLKQASLCNPLEPLGLELGKITVRKH